MKNFFKFLALKLGKKPSDQFDDHALARLTKRGAAAIDDVASGKTVHGRLVTDPRITCRINKNGLKLYLNNKPL